MILTQEQQAILNGEKGETLAKVMKTLVMYGDAFEAEKLVPITPNYNHLVTSFGLKALGPVYDLMEKLLADGCAVKVKRVEENDERNIRIRERAGFRTSQVILGVLCVCALTSAFANFELYVTLLFVGLIILHGILLVGFQMYYEKRI